MYPAQIPYKKGIKAVLRKLEKWKNKTVFYKMIITAVMCLSWHLKWHLGNNAKLPSFSFASLFLWITLHVTECWSCQLRQIPYRARICEPEVSPSSLLARFPGGEMIIFAIQAAEINRHGGKREPGSGQQEAFNWATSRQGEPMDSLVK